MAILRLEQILVFFLWLPFGSPICYDQVLQFVKKYQESFKFCHQGFTKCIFLFRPLTILWIPDRISRLTKTFNHNQSPFWFLTRPVVENLYDDAGRMLSDKVAWFFLTIICCQHGHYLSEKVNFSSSRSVECLSTRQIFCHLREAFPEKKPFFWTWPKLIFTLFPKVKKLPKLVCTVQGGGPPCQNWFYHLLILTLFKSEKAAYITCKGGGLICPSEMEVAMRYTLFTLFTLFSLFMLFKLLDTAIQ